MKCLKDHVWEDCTCPDEEVDQLLRDKAWMTGLFCCMVALMIWVAFG